MKPNQTSGQGVTDEARRRGALVLRTLPILLIPFIASALTLLVLSASGQLPVPSLPAQERPPFNPLVPVVVITVFFSALIMLIRMGRPTLSALAMIGAWTLITTVATVRFGVTTYFPALLILPICAAGLLIDRAASIGLAFLAVLLVGTMAWLEASGVIVSQGPPAELGGYAALVSIGFWIGLFAAVAALTYMLAGRMQQALRQSHAQAEELRQLSAQLEARVQEQTARLLAQERDAATLEERNRLAREIHDTLAQGLAGIIVQLGATRRAQAVAPADVAEHLEVTERMARESLAEARRSVWNLRAAALERGDLGDALQTLVDHRRREGLEASFTRVGAPWPLPPELESALLRVGQEALANVVRHARARRVGLTLEYAPDEVRLTVTDDGIGFLPDVLERRRGPGVDNGFGLMGMRERLAALGGRIELRNGEGATVTAVAPRAAAPQAVGEREGGVRA
jgi:signal transduction histidine kinase